MLCWLQITSLLYVTIKRILVSPFSHTSVIISFISQSNSFYNFHHYYYFNFLMCKEPLWSDSPVNIVDVKKDTTRFLLNRLL